MLKPRTTKEILGEFSQQPKRGRGRANGGRLDQELEADGPVGQRFSISPPKIATVRVAIIGTAPLVVSKFSAKAMAMIRETHEAGSTARKGKTRTPKDFEELFNAARHISTEGWDGFAASSLRNALISACRLVGFKMTLAKLSLFVQHDGIDMEDGSPLVRIVGRPPIPFEAMVRNANGSVDLRVRPQWREWGAYLNVAYDAAQFTATDVVNLVMRVGLQCGLCEGRPDSKNSTGLGFGTFRLLEGKEGRVEDVLKIGTRNHAA
jgi:hypothetical protein